MGTLTDEKAKSKTVEETDSKEDIDSSSNTTENQSRVSSCSYLTALHEIDGPSESQNWEALAFPKEYATDKNHFNEGRVVPVTPTKYVHARLKCCDDRFASNPQYIFHALDSIEREAV